MYYVYDKCIMRSAVINVRTKPEIKQMAQKVAEELGFNLSTVINAFLKQFIRTKTVFFTLNEGRPTPFLVRDLKQSEEDRKAGRVYSFENKKEVLDFMDKLME